MYNASLIEEVEHRDHGHNEIFQVNTGLHEREILLLPICVVGVIENILVCLMICVYRNLRNTTNIFIFGLCVTNCLFAGVLLPMHCFERTNEIYLYLTINIILIYICNLTAVTVERFIAIIRPLHYVNIITKQRAIRIVLACYIMPTAYCLIPIAWKAKQKSLTHKIYISVTLVVFLILPLIFILTVYGRVYQETHKFFKKHHMLFKDASDTNERKHSTFIQEAKFVCCLFNKHIKHYSLRFNSVITRGSVDGSSIIDEEISITSSPMITRKSGSLYKNVLQLSNGRCEVLDENVPLNPSSNRELQDTRLYTLHEVNGKNGNLSRSMSFDDTRQQQRKPYVDAGRRSSSIQQKKATHHSSTDIIKSYSRRYRKAKVKLTELKSSLAFAMVSLTYMFTWLPVVYMTFLEVIDRVQDIPQWLPTISVYTIGLNAMIDPLLYGFLLRGFRTAIKRTFKKQQSMRKE